MKTLPETTVKVRLNGQIYWLLQEGQFSHGRSIAPLEHCDALGNVLPAAVFKDSYAHLSDDGLIRRYLQVVGSADDLELVVQ
jgi:hypothetical protein